MIGMKATLALALLLPFVASDKPTDNWQPFTSLASRIRFEMPAAPTEQHLRSEAGTDVRTFVCESNEIVFEAVAMEMDQDLKMALQEAVSDAEKSVSRQVIDGILEDTLEELEAKESKTEYTRIQKFPCRITVAKIAKDRNAKLLTVIAKNHAYLFIVSYPTSPTSEKSVQRFFDSIRFEN